MIAGVVRAVAIFRGDFSENVKIEQRSWLEGSESYYTLS